MSHSNVHLAVHVVFATKNRQPWITAALEEEVWRYIGGVVEGVGAGVHAVGGVEDHVHVVIELAPTQSLASVVKAMKGSSSRWLSVDRGLTGFAWQSGYGAFAVSRSALGKVVAYVGRQREHHTRLGYEHELRALGGDAGR